jgi:hypothetical protein
MGNDESALLRLWREKRGELEREDLSGNLLVQLGLATEDLNRRWYQANTGQILTDVQRQIRHPVLRWMAATLDGRVEATGAVFEAKFMLPWAFSEEAAAEKYLPPPVITESTADLAATTHILCCSCGIYMPQLQHKKYNAKEAIGHGLRGKRSKSGAISFDLQEAEGNHAAL